MKTFCAKTSFDFHAKSLNFIRKSDVTSIFLVLDVGDSSPPHHGYCLPCSASPVDSKDVMDEVCLWAKTWILRLKFNKKH